MTRSQFFCGTAIVAIASATPALAQETRKPSMTSPASTSQTNTPVDNTDTLGEIIVTAQRREENLQRVAVPVDVVSAAAVIKSGATDVTGLTAVAPALSISPNGGGTASFFIRGIGNFSSNATLDSAIAFNYDNVYIPRATGTAGLFYDLARIEVLKGPQGTLYGRNATGGAINVNPVHPKTGEFSGYLTGSYGNYDAANIEGAINFPLGENGALRVSGTYARHDGYLSDGTSDQNQGGIRVQLLGELTPRLTVRVAFDYQHIGGRGLGASYANGRRYDAATNTFSIQDSGLSRSIGLYDPRAQAFRTTLADTVAGRYLAPLGTPSYTNNTVYGVNAEIGYDVGFGQLTIIPSWRYSKPDAITNVPGFLAGLRGKDEQYGIEARIAGNRIGILDYTLGAFYYHEDNSDLIAVTQQTLYGSLPLKQKLNSYAAFGRLTAYVTDQFRIVGGIRYTRDIKDFSGVQDGITVVCFVPPTVPFPARCPSAPQLPFTWTLAQQTSVPVGPVGVPVPVPGTGAAVIHSLYGVTDTLRTGKVTYRAALEYDVGPRSLLYASFETGFRSGGFNIARGFETFQPETIDAWTVGSKNRFFNNRLQLNIEGFYWKYHNQQLAHIGVDLVGQNANFTQNIGEETIYGVDTQVRFALNPTLVLNAQVQYVHTKYDSFKYNVPATVIPTTGCAVGPDPSRPPYYLVDCTGKTGLNAPKWSINLGVEKTFVIGDYKVVASADTQYRSSRYVGFEFQPAELQGSTWQTDLLLSAGPRDDRWSISGFVRNLENDRYVVNAQYFLFGNGVAYATAAPRTYGVRASMKF